MNLWVGDVIHGFAGGVFGRDSYTCRRIEAIGIDWIVTRNKNGVAEFAPRAQVESLTDRDDRSYCSDECGR